MTFQLENYMMENGQVQSYAFPGGYPMYYVCRDNGILCPDCVNKEIELVKAATDPQWEVIAAEINYEDEFLQCDHCYRLIESAYKD